MKTTAIASTTYEIAAGRSVKLKLKLTPTGLRLLKKAHRRLKVTLKLTPKASAGKMVTKNVTLKSAGK